MRHPGIVIALQTRDAIMKITTALLAGTVIPTLVLLVQPAHAESASGIVVAQAKPEKEDKKPAPAKPAKPSSRYQPIQRCTA